MLVLGKAFGTLNFHQKLEIVHTRCDLYSSTLQSLEYREKQHKEILEWVWPSSTKYITPKRPKDLGDTCCWFLDSPNYLDWVGEGPSTLICSGKGTSFYISPLINLSWLWKVTSRV